jgi:hypothetical protein
MNNKYTYITIGVVAVILFLIYFINQQQKAKAAAALAQTQLNQQIALGNIKYQGQPVGGLGQTLASLAPFAALL